MPIPKTLLKAAFVTLSEKTVRRVAEHLDIRGRQCLSRDELCSKLSRDDGTYLQSYTSYFSVAELKLIASVFDINVAGMKKNDLDSAIWGFISDYDKVSKKLTYEDVFENTRASGFAERLSTWMDARHSVLKLKDLSDGEKLLWEIRYAIMDIHGNSFPGFFESGHNDRPEVFAQALLEIGAKKTKAAFERIGKLLFDGSVPKTTKARSRALHVEDDDETEALDSLINKCHELWQNTGEDIAALSIRFAAKNSERFK